MHADDAARMLIPAAIDVIEIDDVFEASTASARPRLRAREELALDFEVLDDRLDHELRADEIAERMHGHDARGGGLRSGGIELALGGELRQRVGDLLLRRVGRAHARVEHVHAVAGKRCDLCDACTHRAGADDGDLG